MYPYIILLIVLCAACVLSHLGQFARVQNRFSNFVEEPNIGIWITWRNILFVSICLYLIIFSGLRYYVGTDYWGYIDAYNQQLSGSFYNWHFEIGFLLIMKVIALLKVNYVCFFSAISAIIIIPIAKGIKKMSPYPILSITLYVLLYFFCSSFNTIRQAMAISIMMWSSQYIFKRNFWKYLICVLAASTFHISAIVFIGLYFIRNVRVTPKLKLAMGLFAAVMVLFGERLITVLISMWPRFSIYVGYESGSAISDMIVQVLLLLLLERIRHRIVTKDDKIKYDFFYICTFMAIMMAAMAGVNVMFARLEAFFYVFAILAIPFGIHHLKRDKILCCFLFLSLGMLIFIRYLLNNNCGVVPYQLSPLVGF